MTRNTLNGSTGIAGEVSGAGRSPAPTPIWHVLKGLALEGAEEEYGPPGSRFGTPALDIDGLVWTRSRPMPAVDVPVAEVIDYLDATAHAMREDRDGILAEAEERLSNVSSVDRDLVSRAYANLSNVLTRASLEHQVNHELGGPEILDGWVETPTVTGRPFRVRAFPPRLVHIIAGNGPGVSASTIARGALSKGVNLLKLPSNDLFTAPAILRIMASVDPEHPTLRSFSAAYWRGGDATVENVLFRPQFFDKIVAWGGESTIRSAVKYLGPGLELVAFDPKSSISMVGKEAFVDDETLQATASLAAADVTILNQTACSSSRTIFIEGDRADADRFSEALHPQLGVERPTNSACGPAPSSELRDEIDALRGIDGFYRVWGEYDGRGVTIRSDDPVDFYPDMRVVNVVPVSSLESAVSQVTVATQTVGTFPPERKAALRDALMSAGAQRIVTLGEAAIVERGMPHDGFKPLHRFMRWVNDEG